MIIDQIIYLILHNANDIDRIDLICITFILENSYIKNFLFNFLCDYCNNIIFNIIYQMLRK